MLNRNIEQKAAILLSIACEFLEACSDAHAQRRGRDAGLPPGPRRRSDRDAAASREESSVTCLRVSPRTVGAQLSYVRLEGRIGSLRIPLGIAARAKVVVLRENFAEDARQAGPCFAFERTSTAAHNVLASALGWLDYDTSLQATAVNWDQYSTNVRALTITLGAYEETLIDTNPSSPNFGALRSFHSVGPAAQALFRSVLLRQLNEHREQTIAFLRTRSDIDARVVGRWMLNRDNIRDWNALNQAIVQERPPPSRGRSAASIRNEDVLSNVQEPPPDPNCLPRLRGRSPASTPTLASGALEVRRNDQIAVFVPTLLELPDAAVAVAASVSLPPFEQSSAASMEDAGADCTAPAAGFEDAQAD